MVERCFVREKDERVTGLRLNQQRYVFRLNAGEVGIAQVTEICEEYIVVNLPENSAKILPGLFIGEIGAQDQRVRRLWNPVHPAKLGAARVRSQTSDDRYFLTCLTLGS